MRNESRLDLGVLVHRQRSRSLSIPLQLRAQKRLAITQAQFQQVGERLASTEAALQRQEQWKDQLEELITDQRKVTTHSLQSCSWQWTPPRELASRGSSKRRKWYTILGKSITYRTELFFVLFSCYIYRSGEPRGLFLGV